MTFSVRRGLLFFGLVAACEAPSASPSDEATASASQASSASSATLPTNNGSAATAAAFEPQGPFQTGFSDPVGLTAIAASGRTIAVAAGPNLVILDPSSGQRLCTTYADDLDRKAEFTALAVSRDGSRVAARQGAAGVVVLERDTCRAVFHGKVSDGLAHGSLRFSADGETLAVLTDGTRKYQLVQALDLRSGAAHSPLRALDATPEEDPRPEAFLAPDGRTALRLVELDVEKKKEGCETQATPKRWALESVQLGARPSDSALTFGDAATISADFTEHPKPIAFSDDAALAVIVSGAQVGLYDLARSERKFSFESSPPLAAAIAPDGSRVLILYPDRLEVRASSGVVSTTPLPTRTVATQPFAPIASTVVTPRVGFSSAGAGVFATYALDAGTNAQTLRGTAIYLACSGASLDACVEQRGEFSIDMPFPNFAWPDMVGGFSDDGRSVALPNGTLLQFGKSVMGSSTSSASSAP
ncbi:MAG: hypothetical protein U0271_09520 [Polyangiaceae bacterium]